MLTRAEGGWLHGPLQIRPFLLKSDASQYRRWAEESILTAVQEQFEALAKRAGATLHERAVGGRIASKSARPPASTPPAPRR